jgi:hypothetical protein
MGQVPQKTDVGRYGQGIQDILLPSQQQPFGAKEWVEARRRRGTLVPWLESRQ